MLAGEILVERLPLCVIGHQYVISPTRVLRQNVWTEICTAREQKWGGCMLIEAMAVSA